MTCECANCGREIVNLYFYNNNCYGSECIKRFRLSAAAKRYAQTVNKGNAAQIASKFGVTVEVKEIARSMSGRVCYNVYAILGERKIELPCKADKFLEFLKTN